MWQEVQVILSHEQTHTGEKPHPCKACDKKFGYWDFFFNEQTYWGGTSLQIMWQEVQIILSHEQTHTGEKPHHCKECKKN